MKWDSYSEDNLPWARKLGMEKIHVKPRADRKQILTFHRRNDSKSITESKIFAKLNLALLKINLRPG